MSLALSGCGGTEVVRPTVSVSVGQQLIDLKKAHDSGALSDKEYQSQKAQLINSVQ
ncbi:MAG TPA: SHOCT domain-containing protein [Steroidobacteraceae bacterium]|nr:SHOCT domain-containing protein [Steroidobacteraceae bacterium]